MKWNFPTNNDGDINGISNAGIEMFQGTPLKSLAREICQNSLDAAINENITKVEFELFNLNNIEVPDIESLKKVFNLSYDFWSVQKSTKAKDFYTRAIELSNNQIIPVLRISDFNTRGLEGSDGDYNTAWCNLTKSSGTSDKSGSTGGSFGIGKYAPFACSDFRTVFYNTVDVEGKKAFQGISRLASFKNSQGDITTGVGYFGNDHNKPIFHQGRLGTFNREEKDTGTDIYILGFKYTDWKEDIILSILDGFLYAIYNRKLEVCIDNNTIINKDTLDSIISEYIGEKNSSIKEYYDVLVSKETVWKETNLKNKGIVKLGLIIKENETKRSVAMIRKTGMKILDKNGINSYIQFSGVLIFEGREINEYLIRMENPEHTKWEPFRMRGHEEEAKRFLRDITIFIKNSLTSLIQNQKGEEFDPMLGDLLPYESTDESKSKSMVEVLSDEVKEIQKKEREIINTKNKINTIDKLGDDSIRDINGEEGKSPLGAGHHNGKGSGNNDGIGDNEGEGYGNYGSKIEKVVNIKSSKVRVICTNKNDGYYSINFVPACDAKDCFIDIFMVAETDYYNVEIVEGKGFGNAYQAIFKNNRISNISFQAGVPTRFRIKIINSDYCALEVRAYGVKI